MHNAPAVTYPVGRSHFQGWLIGVLALIGCAAGLLWSSQPGALNWRHYVFALSSLLTSLGAGVRWLRSPAGRLRWDGQSWCWSETPSGSDKMGLLAVQLDLQGLLLVRFQPEIGSPFWLWLERRTQPARWQDLRRAAFAPPSTPRPDEATPQRPGWGV